MIPKIFHFIWITKNIFNEESYFPDHIKCQIQTYKKINPDFQIKLWTNKEIRNLFNKEKELYINNINISKKFFNIKTKLVQKTDILRMVILYKYGGIYCDSDTICVGEFKELLNKQFFIGEEKAKCTEHMHNRYSVTTNMHYINNTIIGVKRKSNICEQYANRLLKTKNIKRISYGPNLIEETLYFIDPLDYTILSSEYFFPFVYFQTIKDMRMTKNTKIIHLFDGTSKNGI